MEAHCTKIEIHVHAAPSQADLEKAVRAAHRERLRQLGLL